MHVYDESQYYFVFFFFFKRVSRSQKIVLIIVLDVMLCNTPKRDHAPEKHESPRQRDYT